MLVSHRYQFIVFTDPLGACPWISRALQPWLDQPVVSDRHKRAEATLFRGMCPFEAEYAFDKMGLAFQDYTRIAIMRNPYAKMAQLYYRIAITDPVWRMRLHVGLEPPKFNHWLRRTRPHGNGAGYRNSPRWRKFGAWSAETWCDDRVTYMVRACNAAEELAPIFNKIGINPAFGDRSIHELGRQRLARLYDKECSDLIAKRYATDLAFYQRNAPELRLIAGGLPNQAADRYRSVA